MEPIIIGITGVIGAGKGEVVNYLKQNGFKHFSARDFLFEEVHRRGLPEDRSSMTTVADDLRRKHSPSYVIEKLYERASAEEGNAVIESIRTLGEIDFLRSKPHFYLFAVDADERLRYERIRNRKSVFDDISFEKFVADEARENTSEDPTRGNLRGCMARADYLFRNDGAMEDLFRQVEEALRDIRSREA